jgi:hypothetical protein
VFFFLFIVFVSPIPDSSSSFFHLYKKKYCDISFYFVYQKQQIQTKKNMGCGVSRTTVNDGVTPERRRSKQLIPATNFSSNGTSPVTHKSDSPSSQTNLGKKKPTAVENAPPQQQQHQLHSPPVPALQVAITSNTQQQQHQQQTAQVSAAKQEQTSPTFVPSAPMQSSPPALPATEEQLLSPPGVPALEYSQLRNPTVQSNFRLPPAAITTTTTTTTTTTVTSASHMHNVAPMNSFVPTSVTAASESITGQDFRNSDNGGRRSRRTSNSNASPVHPHGGGGWDLTPSHTGVDNPLPGHHATFAPIASVRSNDHFGASLIFDTQADNMFQPNRHGTGYAPRRQSYFTSGGGMPGITVGASTPNSNPMAARVRQRSIAFGSLGPQNTTRNSSIATNASSGRTPGGRGSYSQISDTSDGRGVSFGQDGSTSNLEREEEIGASVFACTFLCRELQTTTYYVLKAVHQRVCLQDAPSSHTTLSSNGTDSTAEGVGSHENLSKLRRGSSAVQIRRTASSLNNRTIHSPSQSANLPKPAAESQPDLLKDLPVHKAVFGGASHADPWFPTDGRVLPRINDAAKTRSQIHAKHFRRG